VSGFTIEHVDGIERNGTWALVRRALGLAAFGMNLVDLEPGTQIPEHDELDRNQEEVFVVLEGEVVAVIDGERHAAPQGTFLRLDPEPKRFLRNEGDTSARVLIVSAPCTSGYEPMSWA
jgi:uncharacterized cupin superfamily protein